MADTFQTRIPTLSDTELMAYVDHADRYKREAVEAALAELARRGCAPETIESLRGTLHERDRFGTSRPAPRQDPRRKRRILAAILLLGLASSGVAYLTAPAASDYDLHPEDSKTYLRQMEVIGGKANLIGAQFIQWFNSLWHGRTLALTLAVLTVIVAAAYGFVVMRESGSSEP